MASTIEELQKVVSDETRSVEERQQAAELILKIQGQLHEADLIPDDDPAVVHLMRTVVGEEWLKYWPERGNRSLAEAKQIVRLDRIAIDETRSDRERTEAVQAITAIRKRIRGDRD